MGFIPVALLLLQAPFFTTAALLSTNKYLPANAEEPDSHNPIALKEPYGHTANIAPHAANTDREWYTEYRWSKGTEYQAQDGAITVKPEHAPVPKPKPPPQKKFLRQPLNKKPVREPEEEEPKKAAKKVKVEEKHAKVKKEKLEAEPVEEKKKKKEKEPKAEPAEVEKKKKKKPKVTKKAVKPPGVGKPVKKPAEPRYAVPKPCGHTAQVHPYNWNNDREWYTEYRWQKGSEYKIQDGPITEKPVGVKTNKAIQTFPVANYGADDNCGEKEHD